MREPIRIVPLHEPDEALATARRAPAAPPAQLSYRGGPLLANVEVITLFWGADWQKAPTQNLVAPRFCFNERAP